MLLVKTPVPVPSVVKIISYSRFKEVPTYTLAVTATPPSAVTSPPQIAEFVVMDEIWQL